MALYDTTIQSIRYYEIDDDPGRLDDIVQPAGHNVGDAVELTFDDGRALSITWVNPRELDGIGLAGYLAVVDLPLDTVTPDHGRPYDVSHWPAWRPYLGRRIKHLDHIWDETGTFRDAVRIHIDGCTPVTVALGATGYSGTAWHEIDELVVFHDDTAARTYLDHLSRGHPADAVDVLGPRRGKTTP